VCSGSIAALRGMGGGVSCGAGGSSSLGVGAATGLAEDPRFGAACKVCMKVGACTWYECWLVCMCSKR
jgi:hypothetical protein